MSSQSIFWNSNLAKVIPSIVVNIPNENFLVSSSSDKEGSVRLLDVNTSRDNTRDLGLVTFNELFR
jgi:hypothetical protein